MGILKKTQPIHKEYCILGLSSFNYEIAKVLKKEGQKITVIDVSADIIDKFGREFDHAYICDATKIDDLKELGIENFGYVIVGIRNLEKSITICSNLKELGISKIMSISKNAIHKRILKTMGIKDAVIPEIEISDKLAYQTMFDLKVDLFSFDSSVKDAFIIKLPVYNQNLWSKKISEITYLKTLSSTIISIKRFNGDIIVPVSGEDVLKRSDYICLIAKKKSIMKLKDYFMKNQFKSDS